MKKFVVLLACLSLLAAACSANTTIESSGSSEDTPPTATAVAPSDDSQAGDPPTEEGDDQEAEDQEDDDQEADDEPESTPTPTPRATTAPVAAAESDEGETAAAATPTPTPSPTAAPAAPLPSQTEAVQAVLDANDWCGAAQAVEDGTMILELLDFTDPVAVEQGLTQAVAVVSAAERLAPAEIAADVSASIDQFTTLTVALEAAEWNFLALGPELILEFEGVNETTSYNIEKYNFDNCGIGTDPGLPPVVGGSTTPLTPPTGGDFVLEGPALEQAVIGLTSAGFTEVEARCILETLDLTNPEAFANTTAVLDVFTKCGISLDRLATLGQ